MSAVQQPGADPLLDDPAILAAAAALDREAALIEEAGAAAPGAAPIAPEAIDWTEEAAQLVTFATEMFFPLYPRLETVWTPAKLNALEGRLALVLKKYDLSLAKLLGKYGPEIMLAMVLVPSVMPTARAIRADLADLKAKAKEAARAAPPVDQPAAAPPKPAAPLVDAAASSSSAAAGPALPPDTEALHARA
jgi:hypothetical protein